MSRKIKFEEGEKYHIYNRGIDKRITFLDHPDYDYFMRLLMFCNNKDKSNYNFQGKSFKYMDILKNKELVEIDFVVLMNNHYHLRLFQNSENGISKFLHRVMTSYTLYFNNKYARDGCLFASPFKRRHIGNDDYDRYLDKYLYYNPLSLVRNNYKSEHFSEPDFKLSMSEKIFLKNYPYLVFKKPKSDSGQT